jgi:hypothetical protein
MLAAFVELPGDRIKAALTVSVPAAIPGRNRIGPSSLPLMKRSVAQKDAHIGGH